MFTKILQSLLCAFFFTFSSSASAQPYEETLRFNMDGAPEELLQGNQYIFDLFLPEGELSKVWFRMAEEASSDESTRIGLSLHAVNPDISTGINVFEARMPADGHSEAQPFDTLGVSPSIALGNGNRLRFIVTAVNGKVNFSSERPFLGVTLQRRGSQPYDPREHAGDVNLDGVVNLTDFGLLKTHFGRLDRRLRMFGDLNNDGHIDLTDFGILKENFGKSNP